MRYILTIILFSSVVSADNEILDENVPSVLDEETEYVTIRDDSVPVPDPAPIVIYPIEDFIRIDDD